MKELTDKLTEVFGTAGSSAIGHAMIGLAVLLVGLFIVKVFANFLKRILTKIPDSHPPQGA